MLVVIGNKAVHDEVKKIIEELDKRRAQVVIEVAIVQITGDDSLDTGIEGLWEDAKGDGAQLGGGSSFGLGSQSDSSNSGFPNAQNLSGFSGGAIRYMRPHDVSVLIKALSTKSNVNILNRPILLTLDNQEASFTTKVSEPTTTTSQGTATTTTSFAGFADATTSLKFTPQISPDGYINLKIVQDFEEFSGATSGSGVPPPKVSNNINTTITVPNGHTVIMGGFTRDVATDTRTGIPILMDIPILGRLVSSQSVRITKSQLYLFVRPMILRTDSFEDLEKVSKEKKREIRNMTGESLIRDEILDALNHGSGPEVKEADLPFDLPKKEKKK